MSRTIYITLDNNNLVRTIIAKFSKIYHFPELQEWGFFGGLGLSKSFKHSFNKLVFLLLNVTAKILFCTGYLHILGPSVLRSIRILELIPSELEGIPGCVLNGHYVVEC